jgi:hypothetical protein
MKNQKTIIILGCVHACSADPTIRQFRVQITGPKENEEKEELLENLRENISICYRGVGVDSIVKEEE